MGDLSVMIGGAFLRGAAHTHNKGESPGNNAGIDEAIGVLRLRGARIAHAALLRMTLDVRGQGLILLPRLWNKN